MLSVQSGADNYQWYDCINGLPLIGETSSTLSPLISGTFRADISFGACTFSSNCFVVTNSDNLPKNSLNIIPNPNQGRFIVNFEEDGIATIFNIQGLKIFEKEVNSPTEIVLQLLPSGLYILNFNGQNIKFVIY
jgi:hypothetical protein